MPSSSAVTLFGVRHHGPGCARGLVRALQELSPDLLLVEGPPDAQELLTLAAHPQMEPPVALLVYPKDEPRQAVYFPFTVFSPEWQALRYAAEHNIPARFIDLPHAVILARAAAARSEDSQQGPRREGEMQQYFDPFAALAAVAGYEDREVWWDQQIEQRSDMTGLFEGVLELMHALRAESGELAPENALREAAMRQSIRAALREGYIRIAVVCGAWHAPALENLETAKQDAVLLARLPRIAVLATWIPWTNSRLAAHSGYGAGVISPGWYEYLWEAGDRAPVLWVAQAARLLRDRDMEASTAGVVEAVRTAEALAALRDLSRPGLAELHEAIVTVLCNGSERTAALIREHLEVGDRLGAVPEDTPALPLQRDLAALQRRLRLPPTAETRKLDLDLRGDTDRARSSLLHRLKLLDVQWGIQGSSTSTYSTFHEVWQLRWQPELAMRLVEANVWGPTVESAAAEKVRGSAQSSRELPQLTALLDRAILADLPAVIEYLLGCIGTAAALAFDLCQLMEALPPLAAIARYGNVRGTSAAHIQPVISALFERVVVGLVSACGGVDDEVAATLTTAINAVDRSLKMLGDPEMNAEWTAVLHELSRRNSVHGLIQGRACRILLEEKTLDETACARMARLALSVVVPAPQAAMWIEGLLSGGGLLLMHQDGIWQALDRWAGSLEEEAFTAVLPLLRRTFATFTAPERRIMGDKVRWLSGAQRDGDPSSLATTTMQQIDPQRGSLILPVLAHILGTPSRQANRESQ